MYARVATFQGAPAPVDDAIEGCAVRWSQTRLRRGWTASG
jgi:hypothetical protein